MWNIKNNKLDFQKFITHVSRELILFSNDFIISVSQI
jgi:hypothetical protein